MLAILTHFMCIAYNAWNLSEIHKIGCARLVKYPGEDAKAHMDIMTRIVLTYYIWKEMALSKKIDASFFFFFDSGATVSPTPRANTANTWYFLKKR